MSPKICLPSNLYGISIISEQPFEQRSHYQSRSEGQHRAAQTDGPTVFPLTHDTVGARNAGNSRSTPSPQRCISLQCGLNDAALSQRCMVNIFVQAPTQQGGVFDRQATSLTQVWRNRMNCVAEQRHRSFSPRLNRWPIEDRIAHD